MNHPITFIEPRGRNSKPFKKKDPYRILFKQSKSSLVKRIKVREKQIYELNEEMDSMKMESGQLMLTNDRLKRIITDLEHEIINLK